MSTGSRWAIIVTGILVAASSVATGAFAFFAWALALNGFMGQERAVNASLIAFVILAATASLICLLLSLATVYFLSVKRSWNAIGSAILSVVVFAVVSGGLQFLSVIISTIIASEMRTNR